MKTVLFAICAVWLCGCATAPTRFSNSTFTVEVPFGWKTPEVSQGTGVANISLMKELSKTAFVQVQCDWYMSSERPSLESLAQDLEETAGLKKGTDNRAVTDVLGLKGTGVRRSAVAKYDEAKRFNYLIFLPNLESRLPNCSLTIISTGIDSETEVDRVVRGLSLTGKRRKRPNQPVQTTPGSGTPRATE